MVSQRYQGTEFVANALSAAGVDAAQASSSTVAECVMARMRQGLMPVPAECERLNGPPLIDELRKLVTTDDLRWIWDNVVPDGDQKSAFSISLLRCHAHVPEVQARLKKTWKTAKPYVRTHLLWRILDDTALGPEWHAALFEFVLDQWDVFQAGARAFTGSSDEDILMRAFERFGDPSFPDTKKWAYLCTAAVAGNGRANAVRAILELGSHSRDGFTRQVSSIFRARLFEEQS